MAEKLSDLQRADRLDDDAAWLDRLADRTLSPTTRQALRDEATDLRADAAVLRIFAGRAALQQEPAHDRD